jgi:hypothetical protein
MKQSNLENESMKNKVREWRVHIGAHKTATTHFQIALNACSEELNDQGIKYISPEIFRPVQKKIMRYSNLSFIAGGSLLERKILSSINCLCEAGDVIAISEENILGRPAELLQTPMYPRLHFRLRILRAMARAAPITVFLSIRSFDRVLPGAYVTALRFNQTPPMMMRDFSSSLANNIPSWVPIIERLHRALPGIPIMIWRQEDYSYSPLTMLQEFTGSRISSMPKISARSTMTPSFEAVKDAAILQRSFKGKRSDLTREIDRIFAANPAKNGRSRYTFISDNQAEKMRDQYEEDVRIINLRWPGSIINPRKHFCP